MSKIIDQIAFIMYKPLRTTTLTAAALAMLWACGGKDDPETVAPAEKPAGISFSQKDITVPQEGGTFTLTVTAPQRPSVLSKPDWIAVQDGLYKDYQLTYTLTVASYGNYGSRNGEITIQSGSLTATVSVSQEGRAKPPVNPTDIATGLVTSNATPSAQTLYDFLYANYGKKIVSSVMADVAWNNDVAATIYRNTGKYPAANCYDFIHIQVPDGNGWINYSDITPVTTWHNAGGIVSLMWHFNVPLSESTTIGRDGSGSTCSPDKTTFKGSNALKDGTWEHQYFYAQMDRVASVILQLQEAGMAAIWRPFHEAAGNYYATSYKGAAWFWWGNEGPEVFKQLWNAMFDYFAEKGIHNLIWVWTAQNYNGDMNSYDSDEAYYPGDDRVDMVARDLYGGSASDCALEFAQLQNSYPHKMIELGECGWGGNASNPIATIPDQWSAEARWSSFMVWYAANQTSMADTEWWKAAFASDCVLTREDICL